MELDLEKFSAAKSKEERRERDIELWNQWNDGGRKPDDLRPLLTQFRGLIRSHANKFSGRVEIPPAAINAEFNRHFVRALQTYDPNKGAQLSSWVGTNLQKGQRWIRNRQNPARIQEERSYNVGKLQSAQSYLDSMLGREPTSDELGQHLGWSPKEVSTLQTEIRKSNIASAWEFDPVEILPSKEKEALKFVQYDLDPEERLVFDYTVGWNGKPELKPMQIAEKLGMSGSKVSRIRGKIMEKIQNYL